MSSFDLSGIVRFDLERGRVTLRDKSGASDERSSRAVVPVDALAALCRTVSPEVVVDFGRGIGTDLGRRLAERLDRELHGASPQLILDALGGEVALLGLGSLRLELWGRALVFAFEQSSLLQASPGDANDASTRLLAAVLEGAIARGLGRDACVLPIARSHDEVRLLVCSRSAEARVRSWLADGCHYGEALARLNEAGGTS
jgi:hypothetical protein